VGGGGSAVPAEAEDTDPMAAEPLARAGAQVAVVADLLEAARQDVLEEVAQKLRGDLDIAPEMLNIQHVLKNQHIR
jgi:NAD(P)-dependent dehydrogenase (short-subunit alcohol dehydrogenase family)